MIPAYQAPVAIQRVQPAYPPRAVKNGERGTIVLKVLVNEAGKVVRVVVEEGMPGSDLEAAAIDAVLRWEYRPAMQNGHTIRAWSTERFDFEPPDSR
jgi:protein TonB